jgi:hypothetical protein
MSMNREEVVSKLSTKGGGQFTTIVLDRVELIGGKREGREVRKVSQYQVLAHAMYANRKPVAQAVEAGLRAEPEVPSWAEAFVLDGVRLWRHRGNGTEYLPLPLVDSFHKVDYFDIATGEAIDPATLKLPKKSPLKEGQVPFAACKLENITVIK